ncbi:DNA-methyltransferase [Aestuariivirga sp.]|uniref:DNA-methyltransferase n=1 Tax=Aestuariivirga sp. TaxID=2650926 RepID=UPI00391BA256
MGKPSLKVVAGQDIGPQRKAGKKLSPEKKPLTKANAALHPIVVADDIFQSPELKRKAYYADAHSIILNMDVSEALKTLADTGILVNCIVTSPPFYGQRDYGVNGQIGLEEHPSQFIDKLVSIFGACAPVLAPNGSLWVNIGDTYWSGKGEHKSGEAKQNARRFGIRPQDKKGDGKWCIPKQLLLIPHRFAIGMQDKGWIVRNDNIWLKPNPIPDQVRDRCSMSHEYVFHFVKERWYYFDKEHVGRETESGSILPPLDTWEVPPVRGLHHGHKARFSEELVRIPVLSTTPKNGVVLDPFAGSGTSLLFARRNGFRSIGIDIKRDFCKMMVAGLEKLNKGGN